MEMKQKQEGLNQIQFARARKNVLLGCSKIEDYEQASQEQRVILHQIELTIESLTEEELSNLEL